MKKEEIHNAIDTLQLNQKKICIHASMKSFGESIEGFCGIDTLIKAFMERKCTIMVPTFSDRYEVKPVEPFMPERNGAGDYSFFLNREYEETEPFERSSKEMTVEDMGIFAKRVLDWDGSVRGNHPLNSFTALGEYAEQLVAGQNKRDVYAPLEALCEMDGYVLLMGVDLTSATIIHYAEQLAGRTPFVRWAKDVHGNVMPCSAGGCSEGFGHFEEMLAGYARKAYVGESLWTCYRARDLVEVCRKAIREEPMITHCGDQGCDRCRDAVLGGPCVDRIFGA